MRDYLFLAAKLSDLASAKGLRLLTPTEAAGGLPAQRYAIQTTDEEFPAREAMLHEMAPDLWQVMPLTARDWAKVLTEAGLKPLDVTKLEAEKPAESAAALYSKDSKGDPVGEKRLPCVIAGDDPVAMAAADLAAEEPDRDPVAVGVN